MRTAPSANLQPPQRGGGDVSLPPGLPIDAAEGDSAEGAVSAAFAALDAGDTEGARGLAQSALMVARAVKGEGGSRLVEARALACLAQCDRVISRLRRSADTARQAAHIFEAEGDVDGESSALITLAHVSMLLGRNDEAVEAAVMSLRLCDPQDSPRKALLAHNCLGLAYAWAGNFDKANAALGTAVHIAGRTEAPQDAYEPRLYQLWVEAHVLAERRFRTGEIGDVRRMNALVREVRRLEQAITGEPLNGLRADAKTMAHVLKAICAAWEGNVANAHIYVERALGSLSGAITWLDALVRWCMAELAWAESDWTAAEESLAEMMDFALKVEYEQLACLAKQLLAQVYEAQGKTVEASIQYKQLRLRERHMVSDSTSSREAIVDLRLDARRTELSLEKALAASKQFEKWSFEDPLTGIANRRAFELDLEQRLAQSGGDRSLVVAMIDVDKFKAVNDTYGHNIGDRVLQVVARVLSESVREHDLVARLAGDEFVVLFGDATLDAAAEAGERIQASLEAWDWDATAPGLRISISIGMSEAVRGDTVESLVERSDRSMYAAKPGWEMTSL